MQAFELEVKTKSKLVDVVVLSQKNRQPDEDPGTKLSFETLVSNHALGQLDGYLKSFLFTKHGAESPKAKQGSLEGVEAVSDLPNLSSLGAKVGWLRWIQEFTGYTLVIDQGTGTKRSNIEIHDCVVSGLRLKPQEGGSVLVRYNVESPNVSESQFGKLAKLKSREIEITLVAPEAQQGDLAGQQQGDPPAGGWPFGDKGADNKPAAGAAKAAAKKPAKDATQVFSETHGGAAH